MQRIKVPRRGTARICRHHLARGAGAAAGGELQTGPVSAGGDERFGQAPFSIANSPTRSGVLELQIGATPENAYAGQVLARMREQGRSRSSWPPARRSCATNPRPLILMAGGTGFSYARAILEYLIGSGSKRPVFLYWGVRQAHWLYELEQMQQWERDYAPLTFIPVVQEPESDWTGRTGLVHKAIMDDFVSLHDYDIYVAGRFEMAGAAREEFKALGAEPERIFGDAYEFI